MGTLYLVRHGQASFGAADYDQLSPLGTRQCHALGRYMGAQGLQFEAVLRGSLRRHVQSLAALAEGHGAVPDALEWPGLNEYDSTALVQAFHSGPMPPHDTAEGYRQHFRILREALLAWMAGRIAPQGMPVYADWAAGIQAAMDHVRSQYSGNVLVVSSGGPISTAVASVLGAPPATSIELNLRIRNSAVTELAFTPKRHSLVVFNHLPHLQAAEHAGWVTSA
jgi:broad specificity phosphatase PhoE